MSPTSPWLPWVLAGAIVVMNLPFGWWRAGVRKFSPAWFVAVHLPVPLAIGLRIGAGAGWRPATLPLYAAAFFAGQLLGGRLRRLRSSAGRAPGVFPDAGT